MKYTVRAIQRHIANYTVEAAGPEEAKTAVSNGLGTQVANSQFDALIDIDRWVSVPTEVKAGPEPFVNAAKAGTQSPESDQIISKLTRPQMVDLLHFVNKPMHPSATDDAMRACVTTLVKTNFVSMGVLRKMAEMDEFEALLQEMTHAEMLRVLLHTGRSFSPNGSLDDLRSKLRTLGLNREIWVADLRRWKQS